MPSRDDLVQALQRELRGTGANPSSKDVDAILAELDRLGAKPDGAATPKRKATRSKSDVETR